MRCRKSRNGHCYCFQIDVVTVTRALGNWMTVANQRVSRFAPSPTGVPKRLASSARARRSWLVRGLLRNALLVAEQQRYLAGAIGLTRDGRCFPARFAADARKRFADIGFNAWYVLEGGVQQRFHGSSDRANGTPTDDTPPGKACNRTHTDGSVGGNRMPSASSRQAMTRPAGHASMRAFH